MPHRCILLAIFLLLQQSQSFLPSDFQNPLSVQPFAVPEDFPVRSATDTVFFEKKADASVNTASKEEEMTCHCDSYDCECQKECFCKIVDSGSFKSKKNIETWPAEFTSADPGNGDEDDEEEEEDSSKSKSGPGASVFKCGCDFNGHDVEVSSESGLECDCSSTRCKCSKRCYCQIKTITLVDDPSFVESTSSGSFDLKVERTSPQTKSGRKMREKNNSTKSDLFKSLEKKWIPSTVDLDGDLDILNDQN